MATRLPTPPADSSSTTDFSISKHYLHLLASDAEITAPIAAIESLIALLSSSAPSTTAAETLALIESSTQHLKASVLEPTDALALSAGTDLFQRYIVSALQSGSFANAREEGGRNSSNEDDFASIRAHLLSNSKVFVQRAKEARQRIGQRAARFIREGDVVLTCGWSRVVREVLHAAAAQRTDFRIVYVEDSQTDKADEEKIVLQLREEKKLAVAEVPFAALPWAVSKASICMLGAESVVGNGGVVSGMGAWQVGLLAKSLRTPLYVVAESHKFVRMYPLTAEDLGLGENVVAFQSADMGQQGSGRRKVMKDYVPPELIHALVTETGVQTPNAVAEELIKIWN